MVGPFTKEELVAERIRLLRKIKLEFKTETDPCKRAINLESFKMYCRDRKWDAIAGHYERPRGSGQFYWRTAYDHSGGPQIRAGEAD